MLYCMQQVLNHILTNFMYGKDAVFVSYSTEAKVIILDAEELVWIALTLKCNFPISLINDNKYGYRKLRKISEGKMSSATNNQ